MSLINIFTIYICDWSDLHFQFEAKKIRRLLLKIVPIIQHGRLGDRAGGGVLSLPGTEKRVGDSK